mgnify:CR=1 FL=1
MGRPRKDLTEARALNNPGKLSKKELESRKPQEASERLYILRKPTWLSEGAESVWDEMAPIMVAQGMLTALDVPVFAQYCRLSAKVDQICAAMDEHEKSGKPTTKTHSNGNKQPLPDFADLPKLLKQLFEAADKLGLTPPSRKRMGKEFRKPDPEKNGAANVSDERKNWVLGKR